MTDGAARRLRVAAIGCGDVAIRRYFPYLADHAAFLDLAVCADRDMDRARKVAARFGLTPATPDEALADRSIDMILNLTPPLAHVPLNREALERGKHVYSEKPFAIATAEGRDLQATAARHGVRIASAPDTILGPGIGLSRELIATGTIGEPRMASISFVTDDRSWHPDPEFFYREGAGPVYDEAPYFLTALVALLGPVREVFARAATFAETVTLGAGPKRGTSFRAETPTSYVGGLVLRTGVLVSLLLSFDVPGTTLPPLEIYGPRGLLRVPFPGHYNGAVRIAPAHDAPLEAIEPRWRTALDDARGIGVEEFSRAILTNTPSRLEGAFPLHVLECMEALVHAARTGESVALESTAEPPPAYDPAENPRNLLEA